MTYRLQAGVRPAVAIMLAGAVMAAPLSTANAATPHPQLRGTNGQQIRACDDTAFWSAVKIRGTNQNNKVVTSSLKRLDASGCHSFGGWWWKGAVELTWYRDNSSRKGYSDCYVPVNQGSDDWVVCLKDPT